MCGIAGTSGFGDERLLRAMTDTIAHRGPDGEGFYSGDSVHLGSRRLAIQDVPGGAQPMANEDGSVVVVYNGEIYNYPELRELVLGRGHRLTTHCDTEVLPHLWEEEQAGMFEQDVGVGPVDETHDEEHDGRQHEKHHRLQTPLGGQRADLVAQTDALADQCG